MICFACKSPIELYEGKSLPFRATCPKCHAWLHCCQNCRHYKPGQPNDCLIPGTEPISDRSGVNFCEDFQVGIPSKKSISSSEDVLKKLFGEESPLEKKGFDDLFR